MISQFIFTSFLGFPDSFQTAAIIVPPHGTVSLFRREWLAHACSPVVVIRKALKDPPAPHQPYDQHDQGDNDERVNQAATDVKSEKPEGPQNEQNDDNYLQHDKPPFLLLPAVLVPDIIGHGGLGETVDAVFIPTSSSRAAEECL